MNIINNIIFILFIYKTYSFKKTYFTSISNNNQSDYKLINILSRKYDNNIFTQGIFFSSDLKFLYESGGKYKNSSILKLNYPDLTINKKVYLKKNLFGEGIAQCNKYIYQLTWKEKQILKYNTNLKLLEIIPLDKKLNEGWGLTNYNKNTLLLTDGSNKIYYLDCNKNLKIKKYLSIYDNNNKKVNSLNDLVYVNGSIYANIFCEKYIVKINEKNGKIEKNYYLDNLIENEINNYNLTYNYLYDNGYVLNGITYNKINNTFLVTGKNWNNFYEIVLK